MCKGTLNRPTVAYSELIRPMATLREDGLEVSLVGTATCFTSHVWSYPFGVLVAALEEVHAKTMEETGEVAFFWLGHPRPHPCILPQSFICYSVSFKLSI